MPETATPPETTPCSDEREALREQVEQMEQALEARARQQGAYHSGLVEPLGEIGTLYSDLCNHPAALKSYRKALQLLRISDGLLTRAQAPYLRALAESYAAIGDYRSAQQSLRTLFRIHRQGRGELDRQALDDIIDYFALARHFFIDPRTGADATLFFEAFSDNGDLLDALRERDEADYALLEAVAISHLYNLYILLGTDIEGAAGFGADYASPAMDFMMRSQMLTYSKGKDLIDDLITAAADEPPDVRAGLLLKRGNWHQWNGRWQRACEDYAGAWEAAGEALRAQLAMPSELPEAPALWRYLLDPQIPLQARIQASFRVSARGDVSRVDVQALDDGSSGLAARLGRWLRDSHARPAIVDGACVDGELAGRVYRLLD